MPVLDTERRATRSALRYRPIEATSGSQSTVSRQRRTRPADASTTTAPAMPDDMDLEDMPRPSRQRRSAPVAPVSKQPAPVRSKRRLHPLFFVGLGLLLMVLLWAGLTQLLAWGTNEYNTLVYGSPRTFQLDAVVGQGDNQEHPSHFLALNLRGVVTIIDFPAGDPSRARVLGTTTVQGPDADLAVVTLRFIDVSQNGRPDLLVTIGGVQSVLINNGKTFQPPTAIEQQQVLLYLQQHP